MMEWMYHPVFIFGFFVMILVLVKFWGSSRVVQTLIYAILMGGIFLTLVGTPSNPYEGFVITVLFFVVSWILAIILLRSYGRNEVRSA